MDKKKEIFENLPKVYTLSSQILLKKRFLETDKNGNIIETPKDLFLRVAEFVAQADLSYTSEEVYKRTVKEFFDVLYNLKFIPNSPTLLNAGRSDKNLAACFVLPIEDDLKSIYKSLSDAVQIQWKGGGTGFNFSQIRPKGDSVGGIKGIASGPIHFIKLFSNAMKGVRQSGKRGGANMGILNIDHPDIEEFITLKLRDQNLKNFNLSVGVTNEFMKALREDEDFDLINPRNKKIVKTIKAKKLFNLIVDSAYRCGDPGIAFLDIIEEANPTPHLGKMDTTNPCGEQPLLPYESCNLGALNLRTHFDEKTGDLDWTELKKTIQIAVHFLDNVIDVNNYPLKEIEDIVKNKNRKIGLGLMGFADVLIMKEIPYDSNKAFEFAEKLMKFIQNEGIKASIDIAKFRGTFPEYGRSIWAKKQKPLRNATITTIAPNGNTSILGGATGGIEPAFSLAYKINAIEDENFNATTVLFNVNEGFKYITKKYKLNIDSIAKKIVNGQKISEIDEIPEKVKKFLKTAHDIDPLDHLKMQQAFQKYTDNAISKTINFSKNATLNDIKKVFTTAFDYKLKGVTIFRDGSKQNQTYKIAKRNEEFIFLTNSNNDTLPDFIKEKLSKYGHNIDLALLKIKEQKFLSKSLSEQELLDYVISIVKRYADRNNSNIIFSATTILDDLNLDADKIDFFGRNFNISDNLFNKVKKYSNDTGLSASLISAVAFKESKTGEFISYVSRIPGKVLDISNNKFVFIPQGFETFSQYIQKKDLDKILPEYNAINKLLDRYLEKNNFKKQINILNQNEMKDTNLKDMPKYNKLSPNGYEVLKKRALKKNEQGEIIETPEELFKRIARYVAGAEVNYDARKARKYEKLFFEMMNNLEFLSGGTLIYAGLGEHAIMSKCLVLPIDDSIDSIFSSLNKNIQVLRRGVGTGFNFSKIRSTFAKVSTTGEYAAGPIEYLKLFNRAQSTIKGRGGREMGSMAILNADHPNIEEFIDLKNDLSQLKHYNISVGVSDKFMRAVKNDTDWDLIDPHTKKVIKTVKARELFSKIAKNAWKTGDPGVFFLDTAKRGNTTPSLGAMDATNPCGEQPLLPYETCNLGNIDVSKFVLGYPALQEDFAKNTDIKTILDKYINWDRLKEVTQLGIRFLDNIIDINNYPIKEIEEMTKKTRNVGLGIMGFADLLVKLGISYDSDSAITVAEKLMKFINTEARNYSRELGTEKGNFPAFKESVWATKKNEKYMRNTRVTTIAPTGSISIIAGCNPGIEPIFALGYLRKNSMGGKNQIVVEPLFIEMAQKRGFYSDKLLEEIANGKTLKELQKMFNIPKDVVDIFKTTHNIDPEQHVRIQSAFQKYVESAVSKTINLPKDATWQNIAKIYEIAYDLKCKGITIFRDGSRDPALQIGTNNKEEDSLNENEDKYKNHGFSKQTLSPRKRPDVVRGFTYKINTNQGTLFVTINEDEYGPFEVFLQGVGKSGSFTSGYIEAIGRLISTSLRSGIKLDEIIEQLRGIRAGQPTMNIGGVFVYSVPDAVAKILQKYLTERKEQLTMFNNEKEKAQIKNDKQKKLDLKDDVPESDNLDKINSKIDVNSKNIEIDKKEKEGTNSNTYQINHNKYSKENKTGDLMECPECGGDLEYAEGCVLCRGCGYSKCG